MSSHCFEVLRSTGVLLKSDPVLPSVTTLVAGERMHGSWWAHPAARRIFRILTELAEDDEVLCVKLVAGKDTLVHRRLWPEIYAMVTSREAWQMTGLSPAARSLEQQVARSGVLEASGAAVKELELRLLVCSQQFHSEAGSHAKRVESWQRWADRVTLDPRRVTAQQAKATFEGILPGAKFPWSARPGRSRTARARGTKRPGGL